MGHDRDSTKWLWLGLAATGVPFLILVWVATAGQAAFAITLWFITLLVGLQVLVYVNLRFGAADRRRRWYELPTMWLLMLLGAGVGWALWPQYPTQGPHEFVLALTIHLPLVVWLGRELLQSPRSGRRRYMFGGCLAFGSFFALALLVDTRPARLCSPPTPQSRFFAEHRDVFHGVAMDAWGMNGGEAAARFAARCLETLEIATTDCQSWGSFIAPEWWRLEGPDRVWRAGVSTVCLFPDGWVQASSGL